MKNDNEPLHKLSGRNIALIGLKGLPPEFEGTSGVEFYVARKIPALIQKGSAVTCYVRTWATVKNMAEYAGATLVRTPSLRLGFLDAATHSFVSTVLACFSSADIVWYHATGSMLCSFLPKLFGKKVYVTVHALEWRREKWGRVAKRVLRVAERIGVLSSDACFAVSDSIRAYIHKTYGKHAYVDEPEECLQKNTPVLVLRKKYGLIGGDYILYLGRFVPEKRIEWIIEAYIKFSPKKLRLVIAGGETYSTLYTQKLRHAAKDNNNILFVGWVFGKEKRELLNNCSLFVLPSSTEGNPVVLTELPKHARILISSDYAPSVKRYSGVLSFSPNNKDEFFYLFHKMTRYI